jgi:3-phenylpropionate/cinnamic acid dioxygenase small subunit
MDAREMSDRLEIEDLLHAYVEALDGRDWETLRTLFTPDAVVDYTSSGGPRGSVDKAIAWIDKGLAGFEITQHMITNHRISIEGDGARVRCSLINPMTAGERMFLVGGRYEDRMARTPDGWRFAERVQFGLWMSHAPLTPRWPPG